MGEQQVVEVVEKADRSRGVGVGAGGLGDVDELASLLVVEGDQLGAESVDDLAEPGQPGPGLDVLDRGRAERSEVALTTLPVGRTTSVGCRGTGAVGSKLDVAS